MKSSINIKLFCSFTLFVFATHINANEACDAQNIYEKLNEQTSGDVSLCEKPIKAPNIKNCPHPKNFSAGERPASHVVFLMDASGSMGAKLGGKSKMSIAKRESLRFLNALQKEVPAGMIVYGHKGDNTKKGKAESCASVEWVHEPRTQKSKLKKSINALKPVGYTPIGDALNFTLKELLKDKKTIKKKDSVPIVYLLSDGKETCGGDPVASAKALHESGIKAVVNVIGFDVGIETREQLKAISEAGGGKYFPAKDAKALRDQLNAAHNSELSLLHYERCQFSNLAQVVGVHNTAFQDAVACYGKEQNRKVYGEIRTNLKSLVTAGSITKECAETTRLIAYRADVKAFSWLKNRNKEIDDNKVIELKKIDGASIWNNLMK